MKKQLLLLTFILLAANIKACSCRGVDDYYSFFKYNTSSFVGKMVGETNKGTYSVFAFEVMDKLRTALQGTVMINNKTNAAGCQIIFEPGKIYLLTPYKRDGTYNITRCNFIEMPSDTSFREDTMLIKAFKKPNLNLDCRYFKGKVKNGQRTGLWEYYSEYDKSMSSTGTYVNDKEEGEWIEYSTKIYYHKGLFLKMIECYNDSTKVTVVTLPHSKTMYYGDGKVYKTLGKGFYTVFSPDGKVIEKARVKENGYIVGEWILYNEDGTVKEKLIIDKDENSYDARDEFEYEEQRSSFLTQ